MVDAMKYPLLLVTLAAFGCNKTASTPSAGSGSAGSGSAVSDDDGPPPPASTTTVLTVAQLDAIALPAPKGAPASGKWVAQESTKEGDRLAYFADGKDAYFNIQIVDCNLPRMKEDAGKPADKRWADAPYCLDATTHKLKRYYPVLDSYTWVRAVRAGHLAIVLSFGSKIETAARKDADLEAYLTGLDLRALARM